MSLWLVGYSGHAQYYSNEWRVYGAGGGSVFNYQADEKNEFNISLLNTGGVNYALHFLRQWDLSIGAEVTSLSTRIKFPYLSSVYRAVGTNPIGDFDFYYAAYNYSETQKTMLLNFPLQLRFQRLLMPNSPHYLYIALGVKFGLPFASKYSSTTDKIITEGYPDGYSSGNAIEDDLSNGFGTYEKISSGKKLALKPAMFFSTEIGLKWHLISNEKIRCYLYTSAYIDIGIKDMKVGAIHPLVDYNNYPNGYNGGESALTSIINTRTPITQRVMPVSLGFKIALGAQFPKGDVPYPEYDFYRGIGLPLPVEQNVVPIVPQKEPVKDTLPQLPAKEQVRDTLPLTPTAEPVKNTLPADSITPTDIFILPPAAPNQMPADTSGVPVAAILKSAVEPLQQSLLYSYNIKENEKTYLSASHRRD